MKTLFSWTILMYQLKEFEKHNLTKCRETQLKLCQGMWLIPTLSPQWHITLGCWSVGLKIVSGTSTPSGENMCNVPFQSHKKCVSSLFYKFVALYADKPTTHDCQTERLTRVSSICHMRNDFEVTFIDTVTLIIDYMYRDFFLRLRLGPGEVSDSDSESFTIL